MQSFSSLNKKKILFIFMMISAILIALIVLLLFIVWLVNDNFSGIKGTCIIILMAGIPMPAILVVIGYVAWCFERSLRIKALRNAPFNKLYEIGFRAAYINANTRWLFTEETLETFIHGYRVQFNVERGAPKQVEFLVFVQHVELGKEKFNLLESTYKKENIFFDFDGLIKKYDLRKTSNLTIGQLEKELILFVEVVKAEGFGPLMQ